MSEKTKIGKNEIGLVFCGGGARGAYEIGAWRAIREMGFESKITGVSGTSIGAANSGLFCAGDLETGIDMWHTVEQMDLTYPNAKAYFEAVESRYGLKSGVMEAFYSAMNVADSSDGFSKEDIIPAFATFKDKLVDSFGQAKEIFLENHREKKDEETEREFSEYVEQIKKGMVAIKDMIRDHHLPEDVDVEMKMYNLFYSYLGTPLFSQKALERIMLDKIPLDPQQLERFNAFSTVTVLDDVPRPMYVSWQGLSHDELTNLVLASASIPVAFDKRIVNGEEVVDGGLADNRPIKPLYDLGYRNFIIVNLKNCKNEMLINDLAQIKEEYADCNIVNIIPEEGFSDSVISGLRLNREITDERMEMGYRNGMEALKDYKVGGSIWSSISTALRRQK